TISKAYSVRSWPSSSFHNLLTSVISGISSAGVDKDKEPELLCRRAEQGCGFTESSLRRLGCSQLTQTEMVWRKYSFARVVIQHSETISSALCMDCAAEDWRQRRASQEVRIQSARKTKDRSTTISHWKRSTSSASAS